MPPKKKKTITNPVVVGTVSTRSTRRQSVVNIEIPKLTRLNKSPKATRELKKDGKHFTAEDTESFTEQIKKSYSKFAHSSKKSFVSEKSQDTIDKDNRALLEILQDWDDPEEDENSSKSLTPLSRESSTDLSLDTKLADENNQLSDVKQIELTLSEGLDSEDSIIFNTTPVQISKEEKVDLSQSIDEESEDNTVGDKEENLKHNSIEDFNMEAVKDESSTSTQESVITTRSEEVIIEEQASIPYVDDMLIDDQNFNKPEVVDTAKHDSNNSKISLDAKEKPVFCIKNELELSSGNSELSELVQVGNYSEYCQEVQKFEEVQEVEQAFIVKNDESNLSILNDQSIESMSEAGKTENREFINEECVQEDLSDLQIPLKLNISDQGMEEEKNTSFENSCINDPCMEGEKEMDHNDIKNNETVNESKNEDSDLEIKVAEMHLSDENKNSSPEEVNNMFNSEETTEKSTIEDSSRRSSTEQTFGRSSNEPKDKSQIEDISKKVSDLQLEINKKTSLFLEDVANSSSILFKNKSKQKSKPKKTKATKQINNQDSKSIKMKQKTAKTIKQPTLKLVSEKKSKETKSKKKSVSKKEKPEHKDLEKVEKKEKKNGKSEEPNRNSIKGDSEGDDENLRRSSRIKSISVLNKKTTGWGLVKSKSESSLLESDISDSSSFHAESEKSTPTASPKVGPKDRKLKPFTNNPEAQYPTIKSENHVAVPYKPNEELDKRPHKDPVVEARLKQFVHLKENQYRTDRMICKEAKKMVCDCFLTPEELEANEYGCGEDCLNRLLLIECGSLCTVGDRCTNKRFQKSAFAPVEVFNTNKKGLGLRAAANIPFGEFMLEYVGEVLDSDEFDKRAEVYSQDKNIHYYFMALRADAVIDATMRGNISRFINHSCDPNAETQKWTVNGELRIGFFSTRTILAGEEITFDYRFQRYGKEAQKCFCGASICRGWLGEQPDTDEEEEEEDEEEVEDTKPSLSVVKDESELVDILSAQLKDEIKPEVIQDPMQNLNLNLQEPSQTTITPVKSTPVKKKVQKKKPRIEMFEEVDQLNEEIEMLVTTGLKNQAHTLKLSRLMVRAKEPKQRAKLLRVLRRGELPCRRLFLDYHGLRFMHGYMIDAQHLVMVNKQFESLRLEVLQTLAVLPIPNKTMLQDSKVLPIVESWSTNKNLCSPPDSESNSPKIEGELTKTKDVKIETKLTVKDESVPDRSIEDQEEEIRFLATKLLEEWKNLKEVFRIPKKERIEQMKEHEREANKKFMQANQSSYGSEEDKDRKPDRYRGLSRSKAEREWYNRKPPKPGDKPSAEFLRLSRVERRKLFALQHELKEEERKLKQREMWRQHEMNCMMIGADPRFTAPFDPSRGYQLIWNPQIGQWQNCSIPSNPRMYPTPHQPHQMQGLPPVHHLPKTLPMYPPYPSPLGVQNIGANQPPLPPNAHMSLSVPLPQSTIPVQLPPLPPMPQMPKIEEDPSLVKFMGPIPPPVKLPAKWKCAKDKYGRPYYYHVKIRKSQWEPPPPPEPVEPETSESESSSDTSSASSESSSDNSDSDDDVDDTKLLLEVRRQMDHLPTISTKSTAPAEPEHPQSETPMATPSPDDEKTFECDMDIDEIIHRNVSLDDDIRRPSIDMRLKELDLFKDDKPSKKKRRIGLCEEIIISPRTEEDKRQFKEDIKRYKANKEKLKRQKEKIIQQTKKQLREIEMKKIKDKRQKTTVKVKLKDKPDFNSEAAKKIKETFRSNMASTVVNSLNVYRKPDCTEGKITNIQDFKHLARKLTHFVMLKEMKHITRIEDLTCTDNVKMKAREFIKKYMSKFGEVYVKRSDSPDFKD